MAKKQNHVKIAHKHVVELFDLVRSHAYGNTGLATKYVQHIRTLGMRFRLKLPREVKKSFCKHCYTAFAPGENCRVRTRDGKLIYYCFTCKHTSRMPFSAKLTKKVAPRTRQTS